MKFLSITALVLATATASICQGQTTTADQDFTARCSAAGVVKCVGFDNTTTDIVKGTNLFPDGAGTYRAGLDTSVKASGGGALRFDLPPPPTAGANLAGRWSPVSNDGLGQKFGQGSTFYVQYRMRLSPEMLNNTWDSYWKTSLFHMDQLTCGSIELTQINLYLQGIPTMYTQCGSQGMNTTLDGTQWKDASPPYLEQQGDYNCPYGGVNSTNCFFFVSNEWMTFYYKVHVGTWDQANSTIEAWVAREGATSYKQFIRVVNMKLSCNTDPCSQSPGRDQGYNNITFTPYMTGLTPTAGRAGVTSYIWFDELIVSTQPIAVPGGKPPVKPNPPTAVTAN